MNPKRVLQLIAAGRIGLGATLLVAPQLAGRFIGNEKSSPAATVVTRVAGIRDLVIGIGTLRAVLKGADPTDWAVGSAVCDAIDSTSHAFALRDLPRFRNIGTIVGAAGFAAAQLKAVRDLRASN